MFFHPGEGFWETEAGPLDPNLAVPGLGLGFALSEATGRKELNHPTGSPRFPKRSFKPRKRFPTSPTAPPPPPHLFSPAQARASPKLPDLATAACSCRRVFRAAEKSRQIPSAGLVMAELAVKRPATRRCKPAIFRVPDAETDACGEKRAGVLKL